MDGHCKLYLGSAAFTIFMDPQRAFAKYLAQNEAGTDLVWNSYGESVVLQLTVDVAERFTLPDPPCRRDNRKMAVLPVPPGCQFTPRIC